MARKDTPGTGEERDPAGADRVNSLERRARWLLHAYPAAYRRERAEEIIATLLETTPPGRSWPRPRDVRALATGGLKAHAAQNRQRSTATNLGVAVMVGIALYLSLWVSTYFVGAVIAGGVSWPAALSGLLIVATVLLAWARYRVAVLAAALAGSAAIVAFGLATGASIGPFLIEALALGGLAILSRRADRPSWRWLLLPGLIIAISALAETVGAFLWLSYTISMFTFWAIPVIAVGALMWIAVDARPMVAVLTFLAAIGIQMAASELSYGGMDLRSLLPLLVVAALLAPSVWLLRRQSARSVRAA